MLSFNIARVLRLRKILKPFTFLRNQGLSSNYATRVANSNIRNINLDQLEELCLLFNCTPNDLLQWSPNPQIENPDSHSLAILCRQDESEKIDNYYESVPLKKLIEIEELLKDQLKK